MCALPHSPQSHVHAEDAMIMLKEADAHALAYEQLFPFMID